MNVDPNTDRTDLLTWIALVGLTLTGFALSDKASGHAAMVAISTVAILKAMCVGFQFMRLRDAHPAWRVAFSGMLLAFLAVTIAVRSGV